MFDATEQSISPHLKNIIKAGALSVDSVANEHLTSYANGKVSHAQMERASTALYLDYDQRHIEEEARQADVQDEAELKTLDNTLKKRPKP